MFQIEAPYPAIVTTSLLPNPIFGDSEALNGTLNLMRAIDGTPYTYIKRKGLPQQTGERSKSVWQFEITRNKALELLEFYRVYGSKLMRITDHKDRIWIGYITNNPFETTMGQRAAPALQDWPVGEMGQCTIEFEGELQ